MDPTTLATTATALLAPYLVKALGKAAEKMGEALPAQVGKVWTTITDKFKGKPAAEETAHDLAAQPDDADRQAAFRLQLKKALEQDPAFAAELGQLVVTASEGASSIVNIGSGAVATHGSVAAGAGGVAVKGNVEGGITLGTPKQ